MPKRKRIKGKRKDHDTNCDSDESELEAKAKKNRVKKDPLELPRKWGTRTLSRSSKGRYRNMSLFTTMHIDIVYEILGHLAPLDLLRITRTSKHLRELLMTRNSRTVWKTAFGRHPFIPSCPPDFSEPRWTNLLYSWSCVECGTRLISKGGPPDTTHIPGTEGISISLRRRCCMQCFDKHLVRFVKGTDIYRPAALGAALLFGDEFDTEVLDLCLSSVTTYNWGSAHFFWKPDIYEMTETIQKFYKSVDNGVPGAVKALDDFRAARRDLLNKMEEITQKMDHRQSFQSSVDEANLPYSHCISMSLSAGKPKQHWQ